jgi:hypothetical protein
VPTVIPIFSRSKRFPRDPVHGFALETSVILVSGGVRPVDCSFKRPETFDPHGPKPVVRKNKNHRLSGLLHQPILMMQTAKHRRLHNKVTGGQLVSVVAVSSLL